MRGGWPWWWGCHRGWAVQEKGDIPVRGGREPGTGMELEGWYGLVSFEIAVDLVGLGHTVHVPFRESLLS